METFTKCGLRWLLESAAGASSPSVLRHLGTVIHAAAVLAADGADDAEIAKRIDDIWHHLDFGSAWYSAKQREQAEQMVAPVPGLAPGQPARAGRAWSRRCGSRSAGWRSPAGWTGWSGTSDGRGVVVDLKTGTRASPPDGELDRNPQLGVYQLAVLLGAFEAARPDRAGRRRARPGRQGRPDAPRSGCSASARWATTPTRAGRQELVETVAAGHGGPGVHGATVNPGCRVCPVAACCPVHERGGQVTP